MTDKNLQKPIDAEDKNGIKSGGGIENKPDNYDGSMGEGGNYWKLRYEKLESDYNNLFKKNQELEEKLLNIVESFERKKDELVANIEHEKSTLMADVNKLSGKLVDARIKLHDYEEKEIIHATECNSPCHKSCGAFVASIKRNPIKNEDKQLNAAYDPNLV